MIEINQTSSIDKFIHWYFNEFRMLKEYQQLLNCEENSPWHREKNVATHTDMVVFDGLLKDMSCDNTSIIVTLACAFHDFGKPLARTEKFSEERGQYYSYPMHEKISSRMWEDIVSSHWLKWSKLFDLKLIDIYKIGWLIQNHLPYGIKKPHKRENLIKTDLAIGGLIQVLLSDAYGRISDDQDEKRKSVKIWCNNFHDAKHNFIINDLYSTFEYVTDNVIATPVVDKKQPTLIVPIAPSGSGKGTFYKLGCIGNYVVNPSLTMNYFSMDSLRHEWYNEDDYADAFKKSCEDADFSYKVNCYFMDFVNKNQNIYADNTNLTEKSRRFVINEARKQGYRIVAVLFPLSLDILAEHQANRTDKTIPSDVIYNQYMKLQLPGLGEVDEVVVLDSGLSDYKPVD